MTLRGGIVASLWAGAALLLVLLVAGTLWGILHLAGDAQGSAGAMGVTLVTAVLWCLDFTTLVVLLALTEVGRETDDDEENY